LKLPESIKLDDLDDVFTFDEIYAALVLDDCAEDESSMSWHYNMSNTDVSLLLSLIYLSQKIHLNLLSTEPEMYML